ncbi:MAG: dephospho-CoA kinase [Chloroflexi bacterium]|nr:dephospho-CoA kinase [Chloroflexota bacterium]
MMAPDGVNRAALGAIVFADPSARRDLEMLVHPRVHAQQDLFLQRSRALGLPAAVIEAVKIVESGGSDRCDELWIVVADTAIVLDRLEGRGMSREEARRRMSSQGSVGARIFRRGTIRRPPRNRTLPGALSSFCRGAGKCAWTPHRHRGRRDQHQ